MDHLRIAAIRHGDADGRPGLLYRGPPEGRWRRRSRVGGMDRSRHHAAGDTRLVSGAVLSELRAQNCCGDLYGAGKRIPRPGDRHRHRQRCQQPGYVQRICDHRWQYRRCVRHRARHGTIICRARRLAQCHDHAELYPHAADHRQRHARLERLRDRDRQCHRRRHHQRDRHRSGNLERDRLRHRGDRPDRKRQLS